MADQVGFVTMAGAKAEKSAPEIGVGMLGYAFMGKAHTNGYKKLPYMIYPPPAIPKLIAIAGRNEEAVKEAALRYGYEGYYTDWVDLIKDPRVQLFDNGGPNNLHAEPCIAAAAAGKHILCEKPLARTAAEARTMRDAVVRAGVKHMVAFNYRFVPAIRQAYDLIQSGALGEIYHFRAVYLQEWIMDPEFAQVWRLDKSLAGSGALGDLGAHIIDLARWLVGEPRSVMGLTKTFIQERPKMGGQGKAKIDVDDAFETVVEFENGAVGTLEASRFCAGRKNHQVFEINGSKGSISFNLERFNELDVFWTDGRKPTQGFTNVLVTEAYHPYWANWWPHGHIIGWEHTFVHEIAHLLDAIVNDKDVAPLGATFEDGYRNAVICDAIVQSAQEGRRVEIQYWDTNIHVITRLKFPAKRRTPEELVQHLKSFELDLKFSAGVWFFSPPNSRFHDRYKPVIDIPARLEIAASLADYGLKGMEAHYPNEINEDNLDLWKKFSKDSGIKILTVIPLLFWDEQFEWGALSNPIPEIRRAAIERTKNAARLNKELDTEFMVVWPGIDGYENGFGSDLRAARDRFAEGIAEALDAVPGVRMAFEPKPYEPRGHILYGYTSEGLLLAEKVERLLKNPENRSLLDQGHALAAMNPEVGHMLMGYEDLPYAYGLVMEYPRLAHIHLNSQPLGNYDQDLNVGVISTEGTEAMLYALKMYGYEGWFGLDINPERMPVDVALQVSMDALRAANDRINSMDHESIIYATENPHKARGWLEAYLVRARAANASKLPPLAPLK